MSVYDVDLVVVGAGIHGAGVAQAAAVRGHSVLLLEQHEIASGTSSRSSKLIHGGLRYLESGQFGLVYECLQERRILLKIAPHLVHLEKFFIPIYRHTRRRPWQIRAGLSLYAILTGLRRDALFRRLRRTRWPVLPGLETTDLQAVFQYWDAQTDDAALTRAVVASAVQFGARVECPATFIGASVSSDDVVIDFRTTARTLRVRARAMVNAAGPWVESVTAACTPRPATPAVDLVLGTHILVDTPAPTGVFYLESPVDGRAVFVMPWRGQTLVGTTEQPFDGDPAAVAPPPVDIEYLLNVLTHYFPALRILTTQDVLATFAGLRVLPRGDVDEFYRPRETLLPTDRARHPRWLGIYGGKLTAYRATAEKALNILASTLPPCGRRLDTRDIVLPG